MCVKSDEETRFEAAAIVEGRPAGTNIAELDPDEAAVTGPLFCAFASPIPRAMVELEFVDRVISSGKMKSESKKHGIRIN